MRHQGKWWSVPVFAAFATLAFAQPFADHAVEINGEALRLSIRAFPAGANLMDPATPLEPVSALETAKLLNRHLTAGNIEEAALLSTSPRRKFEVLRDYKDSVSDEGFREVFTEYFVPENRLVAEVSMDGHSLLVWHLRTANRYAGQFYVQIAGKVYIDDMPSPTRSALRGVLDAIRAGKVSLPIP